MLFQNNYFIPVIFTQITNFKYSSWQQLLIEFQTLLYIYLTKTFIYILN